MDKMDITNNSVNNNLNDTTDNLPRGQNNRSALNGKGSRRAPAGNLNSGSPNRGGPRANYVR